LGTNAKTGGTVKRKFVEGMKYDGADEIGW
jgi:hypothetical protein